MTEVTARVELDVPAAAAWRAITDWVGQSAWMPLTRVVIEAGDGENGTRLAARTGLGRVAFVDTMVIDVWDPPRRCEVQHLGRVVRGRGVFTVEELGPGRSRVSWTELLEGSAARLAAPVSRVALTVALRRFARTLPA